MSVSQSWFGPSAVSSCPVPLVLVGHRAQIILDRGARASCHCGPCFFPNPDHQLLLDAIRHIVPSATPCHPPHRAIRHTVRSDNASPTSRALSASNPAPEPRIILMRIERRLRAIRRPHLTPGDGFRQPPVRELAGGLAPPTHHHPREPRGGELRHERVPPFPGRFACNRYPAAHRNTSFPCSSNRTRSRASRNSTDSVRDRPGLAPSSMPAQHIHFCSIIG